MDDLRSEIMREGLQTATFGSVLHVFEEVDSTSARAAELAVAGAPEGTVVVARRQSSGHGRMQRTWESPAGGLWFTVILAPLRRSQELPGLTLALATAIAEGIARETKVAVSVRWPNDLYVGNRKLGGILAEARWSGEDMEALWVGVGINVNLSQDDFSSQVRQLATSLRIAAGHDVPLPRLLKVILESCEAVYVTFQEKGFASLRERVQSRCATLGQTVRATLGTRLTVVGRAETLGPYGSLQLQTTDGFLDIWSCEEIRPLEEEQTQVT